MLMADAVARDFARKLVQIERQLQSLFASHGTIFFNLRVKRRLRRHKGILPRVERECIFFASTLNVFVKSACLSAADTAASAIYSFTITGVSSFEASKKCLAIAVGKRMQPCDARYGGT
jgi:hypothetical protein